jgi:hypothetical protein
VDNREVVGRRRQAILGGLLAGLGLVLGLGGGVSAVIRLVGVNTVFQTFPLGEDLIAGAVGGLVLGLGVGLMAASTIR